MATDFGWVEVKINGSRSASQLHVNAFAGPDGAPMLQLTTSGDYVQLTRDAADELHSLLGAFLAGREPETWTGDRPF